jgi:hypothetical protein
MRRLSQPYSSFLELVKHLDHRPPASHRQASLARAETYELYHYTISLPWRSFNSRKATRARTLNTRQSDEALLSQAHLANSILKLMPPRMEKMSNRGQAAFGPIDDSDLHNVLS